MVGITVVFDYFLEKNFISGYIQGISKYFSKFPFWTPERTTSLFYSNKQDTDIALNIFTYIYTILLFSTCTNEL
jgi:hypothetical protein